MTSKIIQDLEKQQLKASVPEFGIGDTVEVGVKIAEGDKERIQTFVGTVIGRRGGGLAETFTVRRIVQGEGVERVFMLHSPKVVGIEVTRHGQVRRAKLHYLRDRVGKATRVKGRRVMTSKKEKAEQATSAAQAEAEAAKSEAEDASEE